MGPFAAALAAAIATALSVTSAIAFGTAPNVPRHAKQRFQRANSI
jgi:hypothetical protein